MVTNIQRSNMYEYFNVMADESIRWNDLTVKSNAHAFIAYYGDEWDYIIAVTEDFFMDAPVTTTQDVADFLHSYGLIPEYFKEDFIVLAVEYVISHL